MGRDAPFSLPVGNFVFAAGVGLSGGGFDTEGLIALGKEESRPLAKWRHAMWFNTEISAGYRWWRGFQVRLFLGVGGLLNKNSGLLLEPEENAGPLRNYVVPYVGVGIGYTF